MIVPRCDVSTILTRSSTPQQRSIKDDRVWPSTGHEVDRAHLINPRSQGPFNRIVPGNGTGDVRRAVFAVVKDKPLDSFQDLVDSMYRSWVESRVGLLTVSYENLREGATSCVRKPHESRKERALWEESGLALQTVVKHAEAHTSNP